MAIVAIVTIGDGAVAEPRHGELGWARVTDRGAVAEPRHGGPGCGGASAWGAGLWWSIGIGDRGWACGWGWRGVEVLANLYRSELLLNRGA